MLKVVVYTDSEGIGGAEISLGHLVATTSTDMTVVGVSETVVNAIAKDYPKIVLPKNLFSHWSIFHQLQPDIIHINLCTPWACAIALTAALIIPNTRIVRVDQLPLRTTDAIELWRTRFLSLRVDAHVAVGKASAQRMEDFYALGRNSVISIPNGVPDVGEPRSTTTGTMTVGSIGRLDAMKAHEILLKAIAKVENVNAVILGEGTERSNLEQLAIDLGIQDRVQLLGWVENPRSYLSQFDVVAMPSRSEGFPLAMVEAMLAARPVIATRVGSMPEAVIDGVTGWLIEKNDVNGLAEALKRSRDDVAFRLKLGQQARQMALAQFAVEAMTKQYEQLWQELRGKARSPRFRVPRPKD
ncbi:MAG: glycosyltransferase family 4 protein [Plectolyngbya sp. WJT66-NPBG17]|jgi:glycosyltransferase involved in cell wall biosynthesis|nr:glycosyltransferase family 4 protein [Plectolyngbya sp. WJT66-NPBG17]MBW4524406.1 glycosyltransferase family 4 protein [Phormidium tanganyikae FI6-MK23]